MVSYSAKTIVQECVGPLGGSWHVLCDRSISISKDDSRTDWPKSSPAVTLCEGCAKGDEYEMACSEFESVPRFIVQTGDILNMERNAARVLLLREKGKRRCK